MKNLVELLLNESIKINDWEIAKCGENSIAIKIGDIKDIKAEL